MNVSRKIAVNWRPLIDYVSTAAYRAKSVIAVFLCFSLIVLSMISFLALFFSLGTIALAVLRKRIERKLAMPLMNLIVIAVVLFCAFNVRKMMFYLLIRAPVAPAHLKVSLSKLQSSHDFMVTENYATVMIGDSYGKCQAVRINSLKPDNSAIVTISSSTGTMTMPLEIERGAECKIILNRTLSTSAKGFLVRELAYTPSVIKYSYTAVSGQCKGSDGAIDIDHSGVNPDVELAELPKNAFWGSNWPGEVRPYGNSVIVRWKLPDVDASLKFLYIRKPYYHFRWVLSPALGVTSISDFLASTTSIVVPFFAGVLLVVINDRLKEVFKTVIGLPERRRQRLVQEQAERRENLRKIFTNETEIDDYLRHKSHEKDL